MNCVSSIYSCSVLCVTICNFAKTVHFLRELRGVCDLRVTYVWRVDDACVTYTCAACAGRRRLFLQLTVADSLVVCFSCGLQLVFELRSYNWGNAHALSCRLARALQVAPLYGSSFSLVTLSVDRLVAICFPLRARVKVGHCCSRIQMRHCWLRVKVGHCWSSM